jgi:hypothetical protein
MAVIGTESHAEREAWERRNGHACVFSSSERDLVVGLESATAELVIGRRS